MADLRVKNVTNNAKEKSFKYQPVFTLLYLLTNMYSVYTVDHMFTCLALYISYNDVLNPSLQVSTFSSLTKCCVTDNSKLEISQLKTQKSFFKAFQIHVTRMTKKEKEKNMAVQNFAFKVLHVKQVLQLTKGSVNNRRKENISAKYQSRAKLKLSEKTGALC